ncbi:MAG: hypothetical protein CMP58_02510 [Flavobacteriales bacterium]|nr:hypothetical protein [Flavobacteriales bacterium]|tara:strand:+ start:1465 stop:1998 length:534 start_codon:yes stop_codon:yes gene_type:complete
MKKIIFCLLLFSFANTSFSQSSWKESKPSWKEGKSTKEVRENKTINENKISKNKFEKDANFSLGFWDLDFNVKLRLLDGVCYYRIKVYTKDRFFKNTSEYEAIKSEYTDKHMFNVRFRNPDLIDIHTIKLIKGTYTRVLDYKDDVDHIIFNGEFICSKEKFEEFSNIYVSTYMSLYK